ncbi:MAG: DUF2306 domain-containing protein, partial [Chloroflexota bacterium]
GLLLLLGSINVLFGALQLDTIQQGPPPIPDESVSITYFEQPIPIVLHIIAGILLNLVAPLQFASPILKNTPALHRWTGRLLIGSSLVVGATSLWMNQYYPAYGGFLKYTGIVAHSLILMAGMGLAMIYIYDRDIDRHRAWMMRAVAAGLGPATQRLIFLPLFFILGGFSDLGIGLVIWSGLLINLAVVEWVLYRDRVGARLTAGVKS